MNWNSTKLIKAVIEFCAMVPNNSHWNKKSLKGNPPRLIRYQRIQSLLQAFDIIPKQKTGLLSSITNSKNKIENPIQYFTWGEFIYNMDLETFSPIKKCIHENLPFKDKEIDLSYVNKLFTHLLKYKMTVSSLLLFNSGVLSASSSGFIAGIRITNNTNDKISGEFSHIDDLLNIMLPSNNKTFSKEELIKNFNYPKEDLEEIDMDWY